MSNRSVLSVAPSRSSAAYRMQYSSVAAEHAAEATASIPCPYSASTQFPNYTVWHITGFMMMIAAAATPGTALA